MAYLYLSHKQRNDANGAVRQGYVRFYKWRLLSEFELF